MSASATTDSAKLFPAVTLLALLLNATATAATYVGWRTDGSGRYPDAHPPVQWSPNSNVAWKLELPGNSYASPILVGERLFIVSDPAELICVRTSNGELVWKQSSGHAELFGPGKAEKVLQQFADLAEQKRERQREYGMRKKDGAAQEALETLQQQVAAIDEKVSRLKLQFPPPANAGGAGNCAATPVSDGEYVYAVFGTGIVSSFSLDGQRRWIKFVETPQIGFGHSGSPVLVDGKLIVHIQDLVALDATSGEEVWRVPLQPRHASPLVTRVGTASLLVTPAGAIVSASDGKVLVSERTLSVSEASPVIQEGIIFAQSGQTRALKLPAHIGESFSLELLWEAQASSGRRTPSPVYHRGLLYGVTTNGILDVTDAQTGQPVYRKRLDIGNVYSSITSASDRLYLSSTRGTTIVLASGREYRELARNELEPLGSCPVFVGDRMYVRARKHLYCLREAAAMP